MMFYRHYEEHFGRRSNLIKIKRLLRRFVPHKEWCLQSQVSVGLIGIGEKQRSAKSIHTELADDFLRGRVDHEVCKCQGLQMPGRLRNWLWAICQGLR